MNLLMSDERWKDNMEEFYQLLNNKLGDMRVYFGAVNNAIMFYVRDAVSYCQEQNRHDHYTKLRITFIWRAMKMLEYEQKNHPIGYFKPEHFAVETKSGFSDDVTESKMYEHWVMSGAKPYEMLKKAAEVMRHRLEVMVTEWGCPCAKEIAGLGACSQLLEEHYKCYQSMIKTLSETLGVEVECVNEMMKCFQMERLRRAVVTLANHIYPQGRNRALTEREQHQLELAFETVAQLYNNPDFYFDGMGEAIEEDDELYKTKGYRKKLARKNAEQKAEFIETFCQN